MRGGTKCSLPKSASLNFSNLASNGRQLAYIHHTTAYFVPDGAATNGSSAISLCSTIEEPDGAQIQQVRWVPLSVGELLVVASQRSIQLYTPDAQQQLHVVTAAVQEGEPPASYRGISSCITEGSEYVVCGVSNGFVCLVPLTSPETFGDAVLCPASAHPIVDVSAGPAPHNDLSRALVRPSASCARLDAAAWRVAACTAAQWHHPAVQLATRRE